MSKKELVTRYIIFFIGLFIVSLGVSFVTKANLGTSPISSIPYVLSLAYPPTIGNFTIAFSFLLVILQVILLGKQFKIVSLLQLPVSVVFGYFIDFTMLVLDKMNPGTYIMQIVSLLIGCVIMGFGVFLEVKADVIMLPGEAFVKAVTIRFKTDFGITKSCFDATMVISAGIISFILMHKLNGVREGSIIAAILIGLIARTFGKKIKFLDKIL